MKIFKILPLFAACLLMGSISTTQAAAKVATLIRYENTTKTNAMFAKPATDAATKLEDLHSFKFNGTAGDYSGMLWVMDPDGTTLYANANAPGYDEVRRSAGNALGAVERVRIYDFSGNLIPDAHLAKVSPNAGWQVPGSMLDTFPTAKFDIQSIETPDDPHSPILDNNPVSDGNTAASETAGSKPATEYYKVTRK
jgi:hypothetical protein